MPRVLLILPSATYRAPDFLDAARRLGVEVVVASDHRQAMMSERALVVSSWLKNRWLRRLVWGFRCKTRLAT